ncbi:MAG: hypothetical protein HKN46_06850 [Acidimicrobiia bacterium]|nr:hypothetical protein [Acidimicrobiia bacterium]
MEVTTESLQALARGWGAVAVGVTSAAPLPAAKVHLESSVRSGRASRLRFTHAEPDVATDVRRTFPWAASVVSVAWSYAGDAPAPAPTGPVVARFATADRYDGVGRVTDALVAELRDAGHRAEALIDDNRLVDRAVAIRSGVAWWGRSTMALTPGAGPWTLLGAVVTDAPLDDTPPMVRDCGTCVACLPACPTGALDDQRLDARRCLAAWLQLPGSLPHWIRPHLGRRIYGCDDCLTACPPGVRALDGEPEADPLDFGELLALDDDALVDRFGHWYIPRRDGRYIRRNLLVAAGNSGDPTVAPVLEAALTHPSGLARSHAAWALARLLGADAGALLGARWELETVAEVRDELALALLMVRWPDAHAVVHAADEWVGTDERLLGLALMGSHAIAGGTADSDLDLLVLTSDPGQVEPPASLGEAHRGLPVRFGTALGHQLRGAIPVDLVIGPLDWPVDEGGRAALDAGIVPIHDPEGRLARLRSGR